MAKPEIQEEIAHLLMNSTVGLTENAIIQQITSTTSPKVIASALILMERFGYISNDKKRLAITPIGRSFYSDLNKSDAPAADDKQAHPLGEIAEESLPLPSGIERIDSFKTPDGKIHESRADAEQHLHKQQQLAQINRFVESIGSPGKQKNIIIGYISKWERFKQEDAA